MDSGLSMASVNKIKELAAAHEYSLAIELLDTQNLEKSLNPQFIRVCGEVYENVGRTVEARNMYVKAHVMAPTATNILYSLVEYYLRRGFLELAELYKEQIVFNTKNSSSNFDGADREAENANYICKKAAKEDKERLLSYLYPYYRDNIDEEWSFELYLLMKILGKDDVDILVADYKATFKNGQHLGLIDKIEKGDVDALLYYDYYPDEREDDSKEEDEVREMERTQLALDHKRMHPELVEEETEETVDDVDYTDDVEDTDTASNTEKGVAGFKAFLKKKLKKPKDKDTEDSEENAESEVDTGDSEKAESQTEDSAEGRTEEDIQTESPSDANVAPETTSTSETSPEDAVPEVNLDALEESDGEEASSAMKDATVPEEPIIKSNEDFANRDFVTFDFDDGFAPESDTIAGLSDFDEEYSNPSDPGDVFKPFDGLYSRFEPKVDDIPEDVISAENFNQEETIEEDYEGPTPVEVPVEESSYENPTPVEVPVEESSYENPTPVEAPEEESSYEDPTPVEVPVEENSYEDPTPVEVPVEEKSYEEPTPVETEESSYEPVSVETEETEEAIPDIVSETEEIPETEEVIPETVPEEVSEEEPTPEPEEEYREAREDYISVQDNDFFEESDEDLFAEDDTEEYDVPHGFGHGFDVPETEPEVVPELSPEPEIIPEAEIAPEPEVVSEPDPESVSRLEPVSEPETISEAEPVLEPEAVSEPETISEAEPVLEPEAVSEAEPISEPEAVSEVEPVLEPEPISFDVSEEILETELEATKPDDIQDEESNVSSDSVASDVKHISGVDDNPYLKTGIEFPEFKTDLFPSVQSSDLDIKPDEISNAIESEEEKLRKNLEEEEKKMRETEALLASLGIKL